MLNHAIFIVAKGGILHKFRYFLNRGEAYNSISAFLDYKPILSKNLEKEFVVL